MLRFLLIVSAGFGIFSLIAITLLNKKLGPTYLEGITALGQLRAHLSSIIFIPALIQTTVLCAIALFLALLWSHSIAGPLVRFKKHLKEIAQGKLLKEPITFRDTDQLHGLAYALSELAGAHKDNCLKAQYLLLEAQKIIDECRLLKAQAKLDTGEFNLKLEKLNKLYLAIKDIYKSSESD